ncbi:hypothetical protein [uncultured Campylobacter sp.]|uniref:hypothetical protein n=1 Tax=uncultured Campylobacter sp. TaxID=218934 RepID=UPI002605D851|nr:hypothetical protein [uncultured Campylobacter sp.]
MRQIFAVLYVLFLLNACSFKKADFQQSKAVFINAKFANGFRVSEAGFLYANKELTRLELYKFGQGILELELNRQICLNSICYSRENFNKTYFKEAHYDKILDDILGEKPIYDGLNLQKTSCGFKQEINFISYELCSKELSFKDDKNKILLKINRI